MGMIYRLDDKQIKKVTKIISDGRAKYLELPDDSTTEKVRILQHDGQEIGQITVAEAFHL